MLLPLNLTRQGLRPTRWGPIIWYFLLCTSWYWECFREYRAIYTKRLQRFTKLWLILLYCVFCRTSFGAFYKEHNPTISPFARKKHFKWLHFVHNLVNEKLSKPLFPFELLRPVFVEKYQEEEYWRKDEVSPHYYYCFWSMLYCTALNYPPQVSKTNENDLNIQKHTAQQIKQMIALLPSETLRCHLKTTLGKGKLLFDSRTECFAFIYHWDCVSHQVSVFGKSKEVVIDYFERNFRTPKQ